MSEHGSRTADGGEAHAGIVRAFFDDVLTRQDRAAADELLAADCLVHHPAFPSGVVGVDGVLDLIAGFHAGFSDLRYSVEDVVACGHRAAARWSATGTHDGPFMGMEPTGRGVTVTGIDMFRLDEDRIAESWVCSDLYGMFRQLGAFTKRPPPERG